MSATPPALTFADKRQQQACIPRDSVDRLTFVISRLR
jgi:hypothetical protein